MKTLSQILGILVLTIVATGCGESFEGVYYTDQAKVTANSCTNEYGIFEMELSVHIEGDQLRYRISSIRSPGGASPTLEQRLVSASITTAFSGSNEFLVEDATFANLDPNAHFASTGGNMSLGKEQINGFYLSLTSTVKDSATNKEKPCSINITANTLNLRQR